MNLEDLIQKWITYHYQEWVKVPFEIPSDHKQRVMPAGKEQKRTVKLICADTSSIHRHG